MKRSLVIPGLVLALMVVGCAKRPTTTQAVAPAPTGALGSAAPPGGPTEGSGPSASVPARVGPGEVGSTATTQAGEAAAREAVQEFSGTAEIRSIHFDYDKYDIRPADAKVLDGNATWLKANSTHAVLIEGHCDERGTTEYNVVLGERRATAARNYLVAQGVQASRVSIISHGEQRPLCRERNEACWARNRRAQFVVKVR